MAHGLQVFDSSGNLTLDVSDRILKVFLESTFQFTNQLYTQFTINIPNGIPNPTYQTYNIRYQDVPAPGILNDGTYFVYVFEETYPEYYAYPELGDFTGAYTRPTNIDGHIASQGITYTIFTNYIRFYFVVNDWNSLSYLLGPAYVRYKVFKG